MSTSVVPFISSAGTMTDLDTADALKTALEKARVDFGLNLARWRRLNNWSQETAEIWSQAAGFVTIFNSQWSKLERGLTPQPGPLIFRALGVINDRIAREEWGKPLTSGLAERLKGSRAIRHPDGTPWRGHDFYAAFMGTLEWPALPALERQYTAAEAEAWSLQLQEWFQQIRQGLSLTPLAALMALMQHVPEENQDSLQEVLLGGGTYSPAQLQRLITADGLSPENWLRNWAQEAGYRGELELGRHWRFVPSHGVE